MYRRGVLLLLATHNRSESFANILFTLYNQKITSQRLQMGENEYHRKSKKIQEKA